MIGDMRDGAGAAGGAAPGRSTESGVSCELELAEAAVAGKGPGRGPAPGGWWGSPGRRVVVAGEGLLLLQAAGLRPRSLLLDPPSA